jgi:hypothetical protein
MHSCNKVKDFLERLRHEYCVFPRFPYVKKVTAGNVLTSLPVHAANLTSSRFQLCFYAKTAFANYQERFCTFVHQAYTLMKNKISFSSYIRKFRVEQLQSHTYMRKGFLIYEEMYNYFPIYEEAVIVIYDFATAPL